MGIEVANNTRTNGSEFDFSQLGYIAAIFAAANTNADLRTPIKPCISAAPDSEKMIIGPFELDKKVGTGTICRVFKIEPHAELGVHIPEADVKSGLVIKLAKNNELKKEDHKKWLRHILFREGRIHARIQGSRYTSEILDYGEIQGRSFIIERLIYGRNLRRANELGIYPQPKEAISILIQVLEALEVPHKQGVVHRDIKTDNILLDSKNKHIRLIDWGSAYHPEEVVSANPNLETPSDPKKRVHIKDDFKKMAALRFMAPEQLDLESESTPAMDIYSAFATAFYLITSGKSIHPGNTDEEVKASILDPSLRSREIEGVQQNWEMIPRRYQAIFTKGLTSDASKRFKSARKAAKILRKILGDDPDEIVKNCIIRMSKEYREKLVEESAE
ncbi:MAG: protein kinase [Bdellovibrionota bacterium]